MSSERGTRDADSLSPEDILEIAGRFDLSEPIKVDDYPQKGNINLHTYEVTDCDGQCFLLQSINERVFTRPHNTMSAMIASLEAQRDYLARNPLPEGVEWFPIRLIRTKAGEPYVTVPGLTHA